MLIIGIDDAGRGPVIGPMALAGVLLDQKHEASLRAKGVKDSKVVPHPIRIKLAKLIEKTSIAHKAILIEPEEIDSSIKSGINLNTLDAIKIAEIIDALNPKNQPVEVVVDCPSPNTKAWSSTLYDYLKYKKNLTIRCEHKADVNHPSVSAASILAKVAREKALDEIKKLYKLHGEMGSGYASDPITKKFLQENLVKLKDHKIFRKSWATFHNHLAEKQQKKLDEF